MDWASIQDLTADVLAEFSDPSGELVVGSVRMRAVESTIEGSKAAERWGANTRYRLSVSAPRRKFTAGLPTIRSTVTWLGTTYRIADRSENRMSGLVTLHLEDVQ